MEPFLAAMNTPAVLGITWAELVGDVTGAACVWLVARQHVASWPIGILNNAFFLLLFLEAKLYADASLQVLFAVLGVYGWWVWVRGDDGDPLPVRRTTLPEWAGQAAAFAAMTLIFRVLLGRFTDSPVPLWDATVTSLSIAATWGQARKLLESWWLWIAVDVLSVPLYVHRGLYPTAALYGVFLVMCVFGLRAWTRDVAAA